MTRPRLKTGVITGKKCRSVDVDSNTVSKSWFHGDECYGRIYCGGPILRCTDLMVDICQTSKFVLILIRMVEGGVQTESTRYVGHFWPIVPAPGDCEDGRGNRRKPAQRHFVHRKSHLTRPGREPGPPRWVASD
jgi:hypothetical protein